MRLRPRNLPRRVGLTRRLMWRVRRSLTMPMPRLLQPPDQRRLRVPTRNRLTNLRAPTLAATGIPKQPQTSVPSSSRKISVSLSSASASCPTHTSQTLRNSQAGPSGRRDGTIRCKLINWAPPSSDSSSGARSVSQQRHIVRRAVTSPSRIRKVAMNHGIWAVRPTPLQYDDPGSPKPTGTSNSSSGQETNTKAPCVDTAARALW